MGRCYRLPPAALEQPALEPREHAEGSTRSCQGIHQRRGTGARARGASHRYYARRRAARNPGPALPGGNPGPAQGAPLPHGQGAGAGAQVAAGPPAHGGGAFRVQLGAASAAGHPGFLHATRAEQVHRRRMQVHRIPAARGAVAIHRLAQAGAAGVPRGPPARCTAGTADGFCRELTRGAGASRRPDCGRGSDADARAVYRATGADRVRRLPLRALD